MTDAHANAVLVLRAASSRGRGWARWNVGDTTLALFRCSWGRCWWIGMTRLSRDTARIILRGLLAPPALLFAVEKLQALLG